MKNINGTQQDLNILIGWEDFSFIKKFCEVNGIVVVSLQEFIDEESSFWNIAIDVSHKGKTLTLVVNGNDVEEVARLYLKMNFAIITLNFIRWTQLSENIVKNILYKVKIEVESELQLQKEKEEAQKRREQEKYEDKEVIEAIEIMEKNIKRIEQLLVLGKHILPSTDIKQLEWYLIELKKLKRWTNFHKIVNLLDLADKTLFRAESEVLQKLDNQKFLIDPNSVITNIDVIKAYDFLVESEEKCTLKRQLTFREQIYVVFKNRTIYLRFFFIDLVSSYKNFDLFVRQCLILLEFFGFSLIIFFSLYAFLPFFHNSKENIRFLPFLWLIMVVLLCYEWLRTIIKSYILRLIFFVLLCIWTFILIKMLRSNFAF